MMRHLLWVSNTTVIDLDKIEYISFQIMEDTSLSVRDGMFMEGDVVATVQLSVQTITLRNNEARALENWARQMGSPK